MFSMFLSFRKGPWVNITERGYCVTAGLLYTFLVCCAVYPPYHRSEAMSVVLRYRMHAALYLLCVSVVSA